MYRVIQMGPNNIYQYCHVLYDFTVHCSNDVMCYSCTVPRLDGLIGLGVLGGAAAVGGVLAAGAVALGIA